MSARSIRDAARGRTTDPRIVTLMEAPKCIHGVPGGCGRCVSVLKSITDLVKRAPAILETRNWKRAREARGEE